MVAGVMTGFRGRMPPCAAGTEVPAPGISGARWPFFNGVRPGLTSHRAANDVLER